MFFNHLKIAWRVFTRRKLYGVINLLGLSVAIAFSLLVVLFVGDEFKYDRHHENADRLFLVHSLEFKSEDLNTKAGLFDTGPLDNVDKGVSQTLLLGSLIEANVPEVEKLMRVGGNSTTIEKDGKLEYESVNYVDTYFFEHFSFDFIYGNETNALAGLNDVVITDEVAMKYFGRLDLVGEFLQLGGKDGPSYRIGGVIKKAEASVMGSDLFLRVEQSYVYKNNLDDWSYAATALFVQLNEGADPDEVARKIADIYRAEKGEQINNYKEYRKLSEANPGISYGLTKVQDLYLDPTVRFTNNSSPLYSYILISVAAIIIIIACINYVAISISLASARSTEVALRKVMGSGRGMISRQFYTEAFMTSFLAILLGYSLMQLALPLFNELAGKTLYMQWNDHLMALLAGFIITSFISFFAGAIPARLMARLSVVRSLKSQGSHRVSPGLIRGMVVFQFTLCIFFIGMGLTMRSQFEYIQKKDLGYDKEQLVYLSSAWGITDKLKQELAGEPSIVQSAGVGGLFGRGGSLGRIVVQGKEYTSKRVQVDYGFIETLGLALVQGRDFDIERNRENEMKNTIVNETMYKLMASDTIYNKQMANVIGVVKDFNYQSLINDIGPISFSLNEPRFIGTLYAKIQPGKTREGMMAIQAAYDRVAPDRTGEVKFIDQYLENQYLSFFRWAKVINLAAILTVLIAASGLFGLTAINVMNRMKEMGIRKVLGAGLGHILLILNKQTLWLLLGAVALALPLWHYFASNWVESFAFHTGLSAGFFIAAAMLCLLIVLLTMSFHGLRTSRINPTQLLRDE